jgi:hypothetical protein
MKRLQLLLCLGLTSLLPASAQDGGAPIHPVIVSRLVLTNQTQPLGSQTSPIVAFTPSHDGVYRISALIHSPQCGLDPCWELEILTPVEGQAGVGSQAAWVVTISGQAGTPLVSYETYEGPQHTGGSYNLAIIVEEL